MDLLEGGDALERGVEADEGGCADDGGLGQRVPAGRDEALQLLQKVAAQSLQHSLPARTPVSLLTGRG